MTSDQQIKQIKELVRGQQSARDYQTKKLMDGRVQSVEQEFLDLGDLFFEQVKEIVDGIPPVINYVI